MTMAKTKNARIKNTLDKKIFNGFGYTIVTLFALICVLPFVLVLTGSFTDEKWILTKGYSFILTSQNFSLEGYSTIFKSPEKILNAYAVTTFVTVMGTVLAILLVTMTGYVLSRPYFKWHNGVSFYFFFTTLFSGGLVPYYLLCTQYLHFKNHIFALIIPGLFSVWNMIIAKSFMKGIPNELTESAKIDGAGELRTYIQIVMPLCKPMVATLSLFTALGYWNDWYNCMLFISDDTKYNLQYTLQNMLRSAEFITKIAQEQGRTVASVPSESMKLAMTMGLAVCYASGDTGISDDSPYKDKGFDLSEHKTVVMYAIGEKPTDMDKVMEIVNAQYMEPWINTTLDVKFLSWGEMGDKYSLLLTPGGDQVDLMYTSSWCNYASEVANGIYANGQRGTAEFADHLWWQNIGAEPLASGYAFMYYTHGSEDLPNWDEDVFYKYICDDTLKLYLEMAEMGKAGVWSPDRINDTTDAVDNFKSGKVASLIWNASVPTAGQDMENAGIGTYDVFDVTPDAKAMRGSYADDTVAITAKCEAPERAALVMDVLKGFDGVNNLVVGGMEGIHYFMAEDGYRQDGPESVNYNWGVGALGITGKNSPASYNADPRQNKFAEICESKEYAPSSPPSPSTRPTWRLSWPSSMALWANMSRASIWDSSATIPR